MNEIESITPETKIGALLDHYPELEETLIELAPAFKKLRNPILRKTVAKVATLRQVAQIGDVNLATLINTLRARVGIRELEGLSSEASRDSATPPSWWDQSRIVRTLDARPIIESGEQPLSLVMKELRTLTVGEIYELITPFSPVPLIEMAKKKNFQTWSKQDDQEIVKTYFILSE